MRSRSNSTLAIWLVCIGIGLLFMARGAFLPYSFPLFEHFGTLSYAQIAVIVSGYFDPITVAHADRLKSLRKEGRPLLVLIATPANPILPAEARGYLLAGLACVDFVTIIGGSYPEGLMPLTQLETVTSFDCWKLMPSPLKLRTAQS